jgi:two-component system phosphate regulon sensor histidine kinase PhoR
MVFDMSDAARKFLIGLFFFLAVGVVVGWLYDRPGVGFSLAALIALAWLVRQLLSFDRGMRTGNFDRFRTGEGIWEQIFSQFHYEHEKGVRYKQSHRQLLREIQKSTNAMPDGAVILTADNEIISCNRAAKQLAGLKRKKDRGQRVDNILRDPELLRLLHSDDSKIDIEMPSPVIDGDWLNCRLVPYGADQKLLLIRDVTESRRLRKMRRDFVANASHELRSPLTVITGYLDSLVDDESVPETWERPVAQMRTQAHRMRQILGEMLELSRLESAGKAATDDTVDVAGLLDQARDAYTGHANVASIDVKVESAARLTGNTAEIESVIVNLLANAVRYTPEDGDISLCWRTDNGGADIVVTDTGEGVAAEDIPRLTERFFRVDRGRARRGGGIGLGLAIVKHVLARHDAELIITSEQGKGSEFRCHFPSNRIVTSAPETLS